MEISDKEFKQWSRIGSRAAFGIAALELGAIVDDLIILSCDTSTSAGLERFKKKYPDKFQDVGIAEQNMMGIAAGLASEGETVYTATFAPFQTMRCCEQIKVNLGYMNHKVCFVGLASGLVLGNLGYTHCCIEDIAVMRSIPNITVVSPADCGETVKAALAAAEYKSSVYIRLTGEAKNPAVYKTDYDFEIGKAITLREGEDITIIAGGTMVYKSLQAAEILSESGLSVAVVNMHTIKPFDHEGLIESTRNAKFIISLEEHVLNGGLGSAVLESLSDYGLNKKVLRLGIPDVFSEKYDF